MPYPFTIMRIPIERDGSYVEYRHDKAVLVEKGGVIERADAKALRRLENILAFRSDRRANELEGEWRFYVGWPEKRPRGTAFHNLQRDIWDSRAKATAT